mmetsp:Transcript_30946/g.45882  ORF Transcript_30946/g.45882 Transcript_30946/m.45882 type:complete len:249 (-) Transcript_30946:70-816(-)|eukprot:CAMPEP_0194047470 /NCGR_PEP_ID=MMETSP0009_2-20130614/24921_1 /TAXON_ID=210454 /ORGANISM="Grammatophora oceanica, Strain CCMP 410" /LENGTH=248 /DNA_ID=CAMNT_0038693113 /DNA_START=79 /DNA_END=825 /DNA_ORIENTATION=+
MKLLSLVLSLAIFIPAFGFVVHPQASATKATSLLARSDASDQSRPEVSRRDALQKVISSVFLTVGAVATAASSPPVASADPRKTLPEWLYSILRAREATLQEARLIKSGKFKDVQRANVKLAVSFIVTNYRLNDAFIGASSYIEDNSKRLSAGDRGQQAVQSLLTILEYFDSSDVQNLKVGTNDNMAGKEGLVLKGLDAARSSIDDFLGYFPDTDVESVRKKILEENELNRKEWDPALGDIVNLPQLV